MVGGGERKGGGTKADKIVSNRLNSTLNPTTRTQTPNESHIQHVLTQTIYSISLSSQLRPLSLSLMLRWPSRAIPAKQWQRGEIATLASTLMIATYLLYVHVYNKCDMRSILLVSRTPLLAALLGTFGIFLRWRKSNLATPTQRHAWPWSGVETTSLTNPLTPRQTKGLRQERK